MPLFDTHTHTAGRATKAVSTKVSCDCGVCSCREKLWVWQFETVLNEGQNVHINDKIRLKLEILSSVKRCQVFFIRIMFVFRFLKKY